MGPPEGMGWGALSQASCLPGTQKQLQKLQALVHGDRQGPALTCSAQRGQGISQAVPTPTVVDPAGASHMSPGRPRKLLDTRGTSSLSITVTRGSWKTLSDYLKRNRTHPSHMLTAQGWIGRSVTGRPRYSGRWHCPLGRAWMWQLQLASRPGSPFTG